MIRAVHSGGSDHGVQLERVFATSAADLWEAITSPERLARWFEPVKGRLEQGGRYELTDSGTAGTIQRCDEPHALRVTWEMGDDKSTLEVTLTPEETGTRLTLRHVVPDNDHWGTYGPSAVGIGWDSAFLALSQHLDQDSAAVHDEIAAFNASDDGRVFIDQAAESWRTAHVASGADTDRAHQQAVNTAAFYKGDDAS
ncbi:SRPBCC family protein [Streptomyces sp. NPDC055243]|uniref:SRPBCC family protein n=1 Tax=Streptomyces sp. NPDC055243 TaxID=3365720 RepID=UPI0037D0C591